MLYTDHFRKSSLGTVFLGNSPIEISGPLACDIQVQIPTVAGSVRLSKLVVGLVRFEVPKNMLVYA
jgi:hypothetical protein